jgi:cytochrome c oxidase subunit II
MRLALLTAMLFASSALAAEPTPPAQLRPSAQSVDKNSERFDDVVEAISPALDLSLNPAAQPDMTIVITGHQYGWRWTYPRTGARSGLDDGCSIASAPALPNGRRVGFSLTSDDIIHEFTIPVLNLQIDAIPGRVNVAILDTSKTGRLSGGATSISGSRFGEMTFELEILTEADYAAWTRKTLPLDCAIPH